MHPTPLFLSPLSPHIQFLTCFFTINLFQFILILLHLFPPYSSYPGVFHVPIPYFSRSFTQSSPQPLHPAFLDLVHTYNVHVFLYIFIISSPLFVVFFHSILNNSPWFSHSSTLFFTPKLMEPSIHTSLCTPIST